VQHNGAGKRPTRSSRLFYRLVEREPVPTDFHTCARLKDEDRRVAKTVIEDVMVSTVLLGFNLDERGRPLFETMVFGGPLDRETGRYTTYDEAERGHWRMVERVKEAAS
jgi:hypothetical protein